MQCRLTKVGVKENLQRWPRYCFVLVQTFYNFIVFFDSLQKYSIMLRTLTNLRFVPKSKCLETTPEKQQAGLGTLESWRAPETNPNQIIRAIHIQVSELNISFRDKQHQVFQMNRFSHLFTLTITAAARHQFYKWYQNAITQKLL